MSDGKTDVLDPDVENSDVDANETPDQGYGGQGQGLRQLENYTTNDPVNTSTPPDEGDTPIADSQPSDSQSSGEDREKNGPDASDVKDAHDNVKKIKDFEKNSTPSEAGHPPQSQGHTTEGGAKTATNAAEEAEQAGVNTGRVGLSGAEAGGSAATEAAGTAATTAGGTATTTAGTAAGTAAGAGVAGAEAAATTAGAASGAATAGTTTAITIGAVATVEGGKELNRIRKQGLKRVADYDKIIEKEGMKLGKIVGITFLVIFIVFSLVLSGGDPGLANDQTAESFLTITQNGPKTASNGNLLSYTVTVSYPNRFENIRLTHRIPTGTQFVSSTNKLTCDNGDCNGSSRIVSWSAKENNITTSPVNTTFTLRLRAINVPNNSKLPNIITGTVIPATTSAQTQ